jgi:hypothetical protein
MNSGSRMYSSASCRFYRRLLQLYPHDHRAEYGPSMLQLFKDQYRSARESGKPGSLALFWIRTLKDLAVSVWREHAAAPGAGDGLMEPVPGRPLPWKGVVLVLVPGLVFLAGQIGQLAGEDWYFLLVSRAAFFLILPVLLAWISKRKFPVWGLIPLGMLFRTLISAASRADNILEYSLVKLFISPPSPLAEAYEKIPQLENVIRQTRGFLRTYTDGAKAAIIAGLLLSILLMIPWIVRRARFPRAAWAWLGVFALVALADSFSVLGMYLADTGSPFGYLLTSEARSTVWRDFLYSGYFDATIDLGFLVLILAGAFAVRRHGRLALLIPLGYLIPVVLLGRFEYDPRMPYLLAGSGAAVLAYRLFVTVAMPLWIVRSESHRKQTRAGAAGMLSAVAFVAAVQVVYLLTVGKALGWEPGWTAVFFTLSPQLLTLAGIGLAVSLYREGKTAEADRRLESAAVIQ